MEGIWFLIGLEVFDGENEIFNRELGMKNNLTEIAAVFDALSNETRLQIFRILVEHSADGITPTEISQLLGNFPRNTLSFHLSLMMNAELCSAQKLGKQIFYKPNCRLIKEITKFLLTDCCDGGCSC